MDNLFSIDYNWKLRHDGPYVAKFRAPKGEEYLAVWVYDLIHRYNLLADKMNGLDTRVIKFNTEKELLTLNISEPIDFVRPFIPFYEFKELKSFLKQHSDDERTLGALNILETKIANYRPRHIIPDFRQRALRKRREWFVNIYLENEVEVSEIKQALASKCIKPSKVIAFVSHAEEKYSGRIEIELGREHAKKLSRIINVLEKKDNPFLLKTQVESDLPRIDEKFPKLLDESIRNYSLRLLDALALDYEGDVDKRTRDMRELLGITSLSRKS